MFKHCHWNEWMRLAVIAFICGLLLGLPLQGSAQNSGSQPKGQTLPDAPAPNNPPSGVQVSPGAPPPAPSQTPDLGDLSVETQSHGTTEGSSNTTPPPMPPIKTVPAGSVPPASNTSQEELYKYVVNTNFVVVPVTVKDSSGHLVEGLLQKDFSIYEDSKPQTIRFFTSDPFALSAAIVLDLSLPENVVSKVNQTLPALVGAFSQYDEVALYTYGRQRPKSAGLRRRRFRPFCAGHETSSRRGSGQAGRRTPWSRDRWQPDPASMDTRWIPAFRRWNRAPTSPNRTF